LIYKDYIKNHTATQHSGLVNLANLFNFLTNY